MGDRESLGEGGREGGREGGKSRFESESGSAAPPFVRVMASTHYHALLPSLPPSFPPYLELHLEGIQGLGCPVLGVALVNGHVRALAAIGEKGQRLCGCGGGGVG